MVQWGHGRTERWRCPPCGQIRRDSYHTKTLIEPGAPRRESVEPRVFVEDADLTLYNGDCLDVLANLPDRSVHMCATSPPFHALRDYGVEGQIGLEETPEEWCDRLVEVFREVRRVLRDDATCWIEVGDSHSGKQLVGQPWLLAFALKADGWWLRSEIIWEKPNAMPESVLDRPTRSHSTVFLLAKSATYFYDTDAIRVPHKRDGRAVTTVKQGEGSIQHRDGERWPGSGANARSVWSVPTQPTPFAHFATWPESLVAKMILAGTSEKGCCAGVRGALETRRRDRRSRRGGRGRQLPRQRGERGRCRGNRFRSVDKEEFRPGMSFERTMRGWLPSCDHDGTGNTLRRCLIRLRAGTTLFVARSLGRHSVGIEL